MHLLLSIKPHYVEAIMDGRKKYEFRKSIFKQNKIEVIYIYSTSPVQRIVGSFKVGRVYSGTPEHLWAQYGTNSGLNEDLFFQYFGTIKKGFAIQIDELRKFQVPIDPWIVIPDFTPPQNFRYLTDRLEDEMIEKGYSSSSPCEQKARIRVSQQPLTSLPGSWGGASRISRSRA